jgi:hypothetical protein
MKEFSTLLQKAFTQGIAPAVDTLKDSDHLWSAKNLRPYSGGLRLQQVPEPLINGVYRTYWPFPQLYYNSTGFWLCSHDQVAIFTPTFNLASMVDATAGGAWSVASFGKYAIAMNGAAKVWRDPDDGIVKVYTNAEVPTGGCCCEYNQAQLIIGNVPTTWYDGGENVVAWSKIGDVSCVPDDYNESGYMPMYWDGPVYTVKQLGKSVVVYGRQGISVLTPQAGPAPTWGQEALDSFGIPYATCVGGNRAVHYFVDTAGELWRLRAGGNLQSLGGQRMIQPLVVNGPVVVTHHPRRDEAYVSGVDYHYVHTKDGWGGPNYVPLSGAQYFKPNDSRPGGMAVVPVRSLPFPLPECELVTDTLNFNQAAFKTTQWIEVQCSQISDRMQCAIEYKNETSDSFVRTAFIDFNPNGAAYLPVSGLEFRIVVRIEQPVQAEIDRMRVRWKPTDRRFERGLTPGTSGNED